MPAPQTGNCVSEQLTWGGWSPGRPVSEPSVLPWRGGGWLGAKPTPDCSTCGHRNLNLQPLQLGCWMYSVRVHLLLIKSSGSYSKN